MLAFEIYRAHICMHMYFDFSDNIYDNQAVALENEGSGLYDQQDNDDEDYSEKSDEIYDEDYGNDMDGEDDDYEGTLDYEDDDYSDEEEDEVEEQNTKGTFHILSSNSYRLYSVFKK